MSREYWEKRAAELEILTQKRTDETVKAVNEMYQDAIKSLDERVKAVFDRYSQNGKLTETEALKLLNQKQTKQERDEILEKYIESENAEEKKRLEMLLDAPAYADRISRLEALIGEIYSEALSFGCTEEIELQKRLISEYRHNYYKTTFDIQQSTGEYYDFEKIPSGRVKEAIRHRWLGKNYSERVWDNCDLTADKLKKVIINGVMTGQSVKTMTDALEAAIGSKGDEGARYRFSRLIRTEVNYISGQAAQKAYKQAGIGEYVFLATLDKRTCRECAKGEKMSCAELDGKRFRLSEAKVGVNKHPMHPYCRCSDYPYIEVKKGTRAARDKNGKTIFVPADMTYFEWYKKYVEGEEATGALSANDNEYAVAEHKKPIFLKKIDYNDKKAVMEELLNFEKCAINEETETALVIARSGKVYKCFGTKAQVFPNIDLGDEFYGATVSHNHPIDVTQYTFSQEDMRTFIEYRLDLMRGCDKKYIYELTNDPENIDEEPIDWDTVYNYQHAKRICDAEDRGIGYRRWKNDS